MKLIFVTTVVLFLTGSASPQTYNSNSGGYNTGYGTVYGSFGMAQATQNIYNTMQTNMQRAMLQATLKKSGQGSTSPPASNGAAVVSQRGVRNYGKFKPDASVDTGKVLGDALGSTPDEKALLKQIYSTIKSAYEKEAAAKGWQNNIAGALTFFIVSNVTVYHDSEEPSEETIAALYDALNETLDSIPEFGKMTNRDKQGFNNMLIAFAAIPLATYTEGKQNGDAGTLKVARQLSGQLLEMILKADPDNMRFENGQMKFGK
jgi:hypothetical protein